jgi:hypothetical protein
MRATLLSADDEISFVMRISPKLAVQTAVSLTVSRMRPFNLNRRPDPSGAF